MKIQSRRVHFWILLTKVGMKYRLQLIWTLRTDFNQALMGACEGSIERQTFLMFDANFWQLRLSCSGVTSDLALKMGNNYFLAQNCENKA